ncbi:MAG: helix-turn-helix domain-containing protein [Kordiimonas sp.]
MGVGTLHTKEYKELCDKLKEARLKKALTQQELGDRLKKPQSYIAKYERAERRLDVIEFVHICAALNVSTSEILDR